MVRVFVSHCANHDDRSNTVVQHLVNELSDDDIDLVWDRELLQVGDDWDDTLLKEIEACDGAILLLAAAALTRPYVVKECTLLAQRKRHSEKWGGNTFEMLSVLIGDVAPETLDDPVKSHMTDLNLTKYQAGKDDDMQVLVDSLRQRLDRLKIACRGDTPRQELLNGISRQIQTGTPGSDEYLATRMGIALPVWLLRDASPRVRALAIASEMPGMRLRNVGRALADAKNDLKLDSASTIIDLLAPFGIPGDAAARIPAVAGDSQTASLLEINAEELQTGHWYACLAYGSMLENQIWQVTNKDSGLGATRLYNEIVECIKDAVIADSVEEAQDELQHIGTPFFIFIISRRPIEEVVDMVHRDFPTVTLVFLTGEKAAPASEERQDASLLKPLLEPGQERSALDSYEKTLKIVRRAYD